EFPVNSYTGSDQLGGRIAMDAVGNFVITWSGAGADDGSGVFARRFNAAGQAQGGQFRVNSFPVQYLQGSSVIAMDPAGDFVIAWMSIGQDGDNGGIYAQRFTPAGIPSGAEFPVNTTKAGRQEDPEVAMDGQGNFVVIWNGNGPGDDEGIFGQRFAAQ